MNKEQIDEFIQLLEKHELSIAALYETFSTILPEYKHEWMTFAQEERLHAKWINTLHTHLKHGTITFQQTKLTAEAAQTSINYIKDQIDRVSNKSPDLRSFLNIAINIEQSLFESAFFRVFELTAPEAQKVRTRLQEATKLHIQKLIEWRKTIA